MEYSAIYECLQQLIQVYVYSEQQYIGASVNSNYPILQTFFEQRALERSDFIDEVQSKIEQNNNSTGLGKTLEELYAWHINLYGKATLGNWPVANLEVFLVDDKALDICNFLLESQIPSDFRSVIRKQTVMLESGILSMAYLMALYHN